MAEIKKMKKMSPARRGEVRQMLRSVESMDEREMKMQAEDEPIFNPKNPNVRLAKDLARGARDAVVETGRDVVEGLAAADRAYYGVPAGVVETAMERLNVPEGNPRQALPLLDQLKMNIQDAIAEGKDIFDVIESAKRKARELDQQNAMRAMMTRDILQGESYVDPDEPGEGQLSAVGP